MHKQANNKKSISPKSSQRSIPSFTQLESTAHSVFISRYSMDDDSFKKQMIKDIVYNEKSHIVALFKDYLIFDDLSEFFKRYYTLAESTVRLPKFFYHYENYSRIFPNYIRLHEAKYIYKSIQKKQQLIDIHQQMELEMKQKENFKDENQNNLQIFNTEIYNSILNQTAPMDEELTSIFSVSNKLPGDKVENSFSSIEKLIDCIENSEKSSEKIRATVINQDATTYKSLVKMVLPNSRLDSQSKVKENDTFMLSAYSDHGQASRALKRNIQLEKMFQGTSKIVEKNHSNILTEKIDAFELNILLKKIKTRNRYQNDFVSMTALQDRIQEEYKKEFNLKQIGIVHSSTMLKDTQKSQTKTAKSLDTTRLKNHNYTYTKKSTVSVPKITKNNFSYLNGNPQAHIEVTIFNNNEAKSIKRTNNLHSIVVNNSALQIRTERGNASPCKVQTARDPQTKTEFIMSEKNTLNREIKSKMPSNIFNQPMGANLSRNYNPLKTTYTTRNNHSKGRLQSQKKDELKSSNTVQSKKVRLNTRTSSALPVRSQATLQHEDLTKKNCDYLYDKYSFNPNAKDKFNTLQDKNNFHKKDFPCEQVAFDTLPKEINNLSYGKMKFESRRSSVEMVTRRMRKYSNFININNCQKTSSSPAKQNRCVSTIKAVKSNIPNEYKIVSNSTKREMARPTISEVLNHKEKQMTKIIEQNLIVGRNKNGTGMKGLHIKGFNYAVRKRNYYGYSNSDRQNDANIPKKK